MNIQETLQLIQALKDAGCTHFKSNECELTLDPSQALVEVDDDYTSEAKTPIAAPKTAPVAPPKAEPAPEVYDPEATRKMQELIATLSGPPEKLLDTIFPNGAGA